MHEYSDIEYFFLLDFFDAEQILYAMQDRIAEEKIYQRWISSFSELSFEEYKSKLMENAENRKHQISSSNKDTVDIMKDVSKIIKAMGGQNAII
ncbi:hypothetical protein [Helcococcus kunzii]|uniref:hypothetical protein n=2 Tax=Helcococcus kunzii TaxID=40091 RepID=UPI0038AAF15C